MRVPVSFYPKIIGVAKSNTWVTLTLSSAQARQVRAMGVEATAGTAVRLRVIKLRLSTGQIETLVTTLTEEEMPEEAISNQLSVVDRHTEIPNDSLVVGETAGGL